MVGVWPDQRLRRLKRSEAAGRVFVVDPEGTITKEATGLSWRREVAAQVFEEAAVDLGRALAAYQDTRTGKGRGRQVGFPRRKKKGRCRETFRLRNNNNNRIRFGDRHPRSVTLPRIGTVRVHDDTRRLRRLLRLVQRNDPDTGQPVRAPHAKILFATVGRRGAEPVNLGETVQPGNCWGACVGSRGVLCHRTLIVATEP